MLHTTIQLRLNALLIAVLLATNAIGMLVLRRNPCAGCTAVQHGLLGEVEVVCPLDGIGT